MEEARTGAVEKEKAFWNRREPAALLSLLRAGLWEQMPDGLSLFPLSEAEWEEVYLLARRQTVTGLVWQGISYLPDEWMPPGKVLVRWVAVVDGIERKNRLMNRVVMELQDWFRREGLRVVLQKGQGVALFYEKPLWRECGDIDFYFPDKQESERAVELLARKGVKVQRAADGSVHYRWRGVEVEHHVRLLDICNPWAQKYLRHLEETAGFREVSLYQGGTVTVPAPELNLLMLNAHIMKHAMGWGVGLRQLCDMARACRVLEKEVDSEKVCEIYRRAGIRKWSNLLYAFLKEQLGLADEFIYCKSVGYNSIPLCEIVWRGGNFGWHSEERVCSSQKKWKRKLQTFLFFLQNVKFSCKFVIRESFWTIMDLVRGQMR